MGRKRVLEASARGPILSLNQGIKGQPEALCLCTSRRVNANDRISVSAAQHCLWSLLKAVTQAS